MRNVIDHKFCLYFHINAKNKEIFYVGIGNKRRPYSNRNRSDFWNNIIKKYGYKVKIKAENLTWKEACSLEKYWIRKIGRRDLKKGALVNLTDGGDGNNNISLESRIKISKTKTGKRVEKKVKDISGKIFGKLIVLHRTENVGRKTMWLCDCECGNKNVIARGEHLKEGKKKSCGCLLKDSSNSATNKPIIQINKNTKKIVSVFNSVVTASMSTNITKAIIYHFLRGNSKSGGGYSWKRITKEKYNDLIHYYK